MRDKSKLSTPEGRKAYQAAYYQAHKEEANEYQKAYHQAHKAKINAERRRNTRLKNTKIIKRESYKATYHQGDIMHSPVEKSLRMINQILRGERGFTM